MEIQKAVENAEISDLDLYLLSDPGAVEEAIIRLYILQNLSHNSGQKLAASWAEVMFYLYPCDFLKLRILGTGMHACEGFF
jgi:hypothetical protein